MKIISIEFHASSNLWHGFATSDGRCFRWFVELDDSRFNVWEEDQSCRYIDKDGAERRCFMVVDVDVPDGAKEAVLGAIRASLS